MNLFELFVKIGVDDQASSKLKDLSGKLGNGLATAAKIGTAAVTAAAAGITALTTAAVNNYAEYEQLVGGVDTLFKDASQKVQEYAENAYKTAGMSANDYMANATAFSASLISSLGGDTEAAAEYANRAMVSMSDNANKMGSDINSIVQTYQSLARGNFAMLDNLKLGYGGTKAELERLIADAASYTEVQKEMGIAVDASSMSFSNIVNAIAVVQGHLGIAGATALEAGTTIEGSVNSMKAAWSNLVTGLADENANIEELVNNLVTTIVGDGTEGNLGVFGNILPAIKTALTGASTLISELFPKIMQEIPKIITENLPILVEAAVSIVKSLVDGISENKDMLMDTAVETITYLVESFLEMLPEIIALGLELIISLAEGIAGNVEELVPTIIEVIGKIVDTLTDPENLKRFISAALEIITELAYGLMDAIPELLEAVIVIILALQEALTSPESLAKIIKAAIDIIIALAAGLIDAIPQLLTANVRVIQSLINSFKETDWGQVGKDLINGIWGGLKRGWESIKTWFNNAWNSLFGGREINVDTNVRGGAARGSHYSGIDYVPADNYLARLHRGERVLTREENLDYTKGLGKQIVNVTQNIYSEAKTAADLMQEALYQQERAVLLGV